MTFSAAEKSKKRHALVKKVGVLVKLFEEDNDFSNRTSGFSKSHVMFLLRVISLYFHSRLKIDSLGTGNISLARYCDVTGLVWKFAIG